GAAAAGGTPRGSVALKARTGGGFQASGAAPGVRGGAERGMSAMASRGAALSGTPLTAAAVEARAGGWFHASGEGGGVEGMGGSAMSCGLPLPAARAKLAEAFWLPDVLPAAFAYL